MKRWFISRMVEEEPGSDSWVPKVATYPNVNWRGWSKDGFAFALGQVATNNMSQFAGDPDIKLIPDAALDNLLSSLAPATRTALQNGLTAGGFDISAVKNTWSIRQLLKHLKLQLQADDNIESGDVRDIEG
ncbi:MAG TPA: hypothetical protein PKD87_11775 [Burkholderiaceae bacterium]|nr:hypothetical protein [Burkholderiaceae bacterium]